MTTTSIEWTDVTWNPVRGCSRVSEGCRNCYAERVAARFSGGNGFPHSGAIPGKFHGFAEMTTAGPRWTGKVALVPEKLDEPLRWRKPRRVFVNSMSDLFHEALPDDAIDQVFAVMALAPPHTFQILTKRPARMNAYFENPQMRRAAIAYRMGRIAYDHGSPEGGVMQWGGIVTERWANGAYWPLPNVWLGFSAEDQDTFNERWAQASRCPAAVLWCSYEPALGPVDFRGALGIGDYGPPPRRLDWIVAGGESGPGARPFAIQWARSAVAQCKAAGVPVFVKQMGRWVLGDDTGFDVNHWLLPHGRAFVPPIIGANAFKRPVSAIGFSLPDPKGGEMSQWPEDLRVRQHPKGPA